MSGIGYSLPFRRAELASASPLKADIARAAASAIGGAADAPGQVCSGPPLTRLIGHKEFIAPDVYLERLYQC